MQEAELEHEIKMPPENAARVPAQAAADPTALSAAADMLAAAERPEIARDARQPLGVDR